MKILCLKNFHLYKHTSLNAQWPHMTSLDCPYHIASQFIMCSYDINQPIATRLHENTHMNQWTEHNAASISTANTIILGTVR